MNDMQSISAAYTLAVHGDKYPELRLAEAQARLALASAIMEMDAAPAPALQEQMQVEQAGEDYKQAMANLIWGER